MKYWELIANRLSKDGWSCGYCTHVDTAGQRLFVADATRGDGRRFIVRANDILTAFLELQPVLAR